MIGQDLQQTIGLDVTNYKRTNSLRVKSVFKPIRYWNNELIESFWLEKYKPRDEYFQAVEILDITYEIHDLDKVTENQKYFLTENKKERVNLFTVYLVLHSF